MSIVNTERPCRTCGVLFSGVRCKPCKNEKHAKYHAENPEKAKARHATWVAANPGLASKRAAEWNASHPDIRRELTQNRRSKLRAIGGKLSKGIASKLLVLQKGLCVCCGKPLGENYHLDHIMPLYLGGLNEDSNVQLLRQKCNNQKSSKHPIDFMQQRGFLL